MMPGGMNGVELAREIKRRRSDIPVLLTSGYSEAAVHDAELAGLQILPKPYHIDELAAALSAAKAEPGRDMEFQAVQPLLIACGVASRKRSTTGRQSGYQSPWTASAPTD